ncbi:MAG: hypothetical protein PVF58_03770 [Candidatus Methanofastidiosia archaeon]|jgi:hypothetical protein
MVNIKSTKNIRSVKDRFRNQRYKLKSIRYINWLIYFSIAYLFFLAFLEEITEGPLNNAYYWFSFIFFFAIILRSIAPFVIRTDISSAELIGLFLSEIAAKLDKDIRESNEKMIISKLSEIKGELDLISSFYQSYNPGNVRKLETPFSGEIHEFIENLEKILRKISYAIKEESKFDPQVEIDLNLLADNLCQDPKEITETINGLLIDIINGLNQVPEDKDFGKPFVKKFAVRIYERVERSYWAKLPILILILTIMHFLFLQRYEMIEAGIIGAIALSVISKLLKS